jgi:hypothetical protein
MSHPRENALILLHIVGLFSFSFHQFATLEARRSPPGLADGVSRPQSIGGFVRCLLLEKPLENLDLMGLFSHISIIAIASPQKRQLAPRREAPLTL